MNKYLVVVEKAENNYSAYAPDVPGCITTGRTIEETLSNMREALQLHLEVTMEDGDPLPEAYSVHAALVEVALPAYSLAAHSKGQVVTAAQDHLFTETRKLR